jgi:hypothetical protein
MARRAEHSQRLVALFALGCLLFSVTLMAIFSRGGTVLGVPLLFAYLFGAWAALVALMALVALAIERTG